jgi:hypothetical protein
MLDRADPPRFVLGATVFRSVFAQATGLAQSVTVANTALCVESTATATSLTEHRARRPRGGNSQIAFV